MQHFQYCMHWCCQTRPLRCQREENKAAFYSLQKTDIRLRTTQQEEEKPSPSIYTPSRLPKNKDIKQDGLPVNVKSSPVKQLQFSKSFSYIQLHRKTSLLHIFPNKRYLGKTHALFLFNPFSKFPAHRNHLFYMIPSNR